MLQYTYTLARGGSDIIYHFTIQYPKSKQYYFENVRVAEIHTYVRTMCQFNENRNFQRS